MRRPAQVLSGVALYGLVTSPITLAKALPNIPGADHFLSPGGFIAVILFAGALTPVVEPLAKWVSTLVAGKPAAPGTGTPAAAVATGDRTVRVEADGTVVVRSAGSPVKPQPRAAPVQILPSHIGGLLGRDAQIAEATSVLVQANTVEVYGPPGIGKSALLRCLSSQDAPAGMFDGNIVFRSAKSQPLGDLLQFVFEALYETPENFRPSDAHLRTYLQSARALVVLDDLELVADDFQSLADALPNCALLTASLEARMVGQAHALELKGLSAAAGLALFERELGRSLTSSELASVGNAIAALNGSPLAIKRAAVALRSGGTSVDDLAHHTPDGASAPQLSSSERAVLATVAAADGIPLRAEHVAAIARVPVAVLRDLEGRGLAQAASPSFTPAGDAARLLTSDEIDAARARLFDYFLDQARAGQLTADSPPEDLDTARVLVAWGATADRAAHAVELGRATESALALARRWGAWGAVLDDTLKAAKEAGDQGSVAWALHRLGTRSVALGDTHGGQAQLKMALALRNQLGDRAGVTQTRKSLAGASGESSRPGWLAAGRGLTLAWVAGVVTLSTWAGAGGASETGRAAALAIPPSPIATAVASAAPSRTPPIAVASREQAALPTAAATPLPPSQSVPAPAAFAAWPCGEAVIVSVAPGQTVQLRACYENTGTTTWGADPSSRVVLAACCPLNTVSPYASWAVNWVSPTEYALATPATTGLTSIVAPGQRAFFVYSIRPPNTVVPGQYTFDGGLVLAGTGAQLIAPGYRHVVNVR